MAKPVSTFVDIATPVNACVHFLHCSYARLEQYTVEHITAARRYSYASYNNAGMNGRGGGLGRMLWGQNIEGIRSRRRVDRSGINVRLSRGCVQTAVHDCQRIALLRASLR